MGETTAISWTDHTANFWFGCVKVSALCDHCYAERDDKRYSGVENAHWGEGSRRKFIVSVWDNLRKWNAQAEANGVRRRVFVMSMGDFFEQLPKEHPDGLPMEQSRIRAMEFMETYTHLDFLVLTKRISNVKKMVPRKWLEPGGWPKNVRIGISVGTQADADRDIPRLLELPCPNFLSMEPLLEQVTLRETWLRGHSGTGVKALQWLICGGESGPHARPSHPDWFRLLRDQCAAAGVPFHFKQWGEYAPLVESTPMPGDKMNTMICLDKRQSVTKGFVNDKHALLSEHVCLMWRAGKRAAGHELDGKVWQQFPEDTN